MRVGRRRGEVGWGRGVMEEEGGGDEVVLLLCECGCAWGKNQQR